MRLLLGRSLARKELAELEAIAGSGQVVVAPPDAVMGLIGQAEAYVPGPWGPEVLRAAPGLRWVHFLHAGVDRDLFPALAQSAVIVTNSAGVFAIPMAEHVLAMMLAFSRGIIACARRRGAWEETRRALWHSMRELNGSTLGLIGYGGIGRAVAERARALGMRVIAIRARAGTAEGCAHEVWPPERLCEMLSEADYVVICCALTPRTRGLMGPEQFAAMKPGAVLVNVARGAILVQEALIDALRSGRIGGAALDVTHPEPLPPDSPLWRMDNVLITPHVSGSSPATWGRQFALLKENLRRYVAGEPLLNVVDKAAGY